MLDDLKSLLSRRQDTNAVLAGPDLSTMLQPGINAQPVQVAITQEIPEPTPEIILPDEPEESEEDWSARVHAEWFAKGQL